MTSRQIDIWGIVFKRVIPSLSIVGSVLYFAFFVGGRFTTIENNQNSSKADIKDIRNHIGRLDTGYNKVSQDLSSFKTKYNHDRETDSLKRQLGQYQARVRQSGDVVPSRMMIERRDAKGRIHLIPTTN